MARVVVVTSNKQRHLFFAKTISEHHEVIGVFCEPKKYDPRQVSDDPIVKDYFLQLDQLSLASYIYLEKTLFSLEFCILVF